MTGSHIICCDCLPQGDEYHNWQGCPGFADYSILTSQQQGAFNVGNVYLHSPANKCATYMGVTTTPLYALGSQIVDSGPYSNCDASPCVPQLGDCQEVGACARFASQINCDASPPSVVVDWSGVQGSLTYPSVGVCTIPTGLASSEPKACAITLVSQANYCRVFGTDTFNNPVVGGTCPLATILGYYSRILCQAIGGENAEWISQTAMHVRFIDGLSQCEALLQAAWTLPVTNPVDPRGSYVLDNASATVLSGPCTLDVGSFGSVVVL